MYHAQINKKRKKKKAEIDRLVYAAVILGPLLTIPQLWTVWMTDEKGASIISWSAYGVLALIWLLYALKHRIKPLIYLQLAWIFMDAGIVIGLLI